MLKQFAAILLTLLLTSLSLSAQTITPEVASIYERHWEIESGIYRVMKNGKVGIIKAGGQIIVPCEYNQVWNLDDDGFFRVLKSGKAGVYHISGEIIIPAEYDQVWPFSDELAKVLKQGKLGYFNKQGEQIIPCQYQQIWAFENGKARVLKNGKVGYIDSLGNEIIPCEYQQIWAFEDGKARVLKNGKVGYIDTTGNEIIPPIYTHIWAYEDGKAKALLDGQMIWIDEMGHPLDLPAPENDYSRSNSQSSVTERNEKEIIVEDEDGNKTHIKVLGSDIVINEKGKNTYIEIGGRNRDKYREYHRRFKGHYTGVEFGFNNYVTYSGSTNLPADDSFMELNSGRSNSFAINALQWSIGLDRRGNIGLVTGLGIEWNNYHFSNPIILTKDANGNISFEDAARPLDKNKLVTTHLNVPLLMEFQIPTNHRRQPFYISAGGIGGMRINSYNRIVYDDSEDPHKQKKKGAYNLQKFRYGGMVRIGYRAINLYGTYYFSTLFEENKGPELYPVSVGLSIYLDI
ncbi:WG repeat-containing protein [Carboxylicivirga sediminis]|uniref:WG repeat-containing protein n=1 Tax=Carboxylicivirga sediminis TaxID=2006564 RepID=A0A941IYL5_9BACT|nr:WG repeat-containing protein [Carboxylicivirga sediminis]MBR8537120.1 WG repeat-containing protein [Carboxylicivirga sediminis]